MRQTNNSLLSVTNTDCEFIISLLSFFTSLLLLSSCKNTAVNRKAAVFLCLFPCSRFGNNYFLIYSKFICISVTHCRRRSGIITSKLRKTQQTLYLAPGQLPGRNAHDSKVARQTILSLRYDIWRWIDIAYLFFIFFIPFIFIKIPQLFLRGCGIFISVPFIFLIQFFLELFKIYSLFLHPSLLKIRYTIIRIKNKRT